MRPVVRVNRCNDIFAAGPGKTEDFGALARVKRSAAHQRRRPEGQPRRHLPDRDQPGTALLDDLVRAARGAPCREPGVTSAERGMARKRQLARRIENPHPVIRARIGGGQQERGLGKPQPAGQGQHCGWVQPLPAAHHRERVAGQRPVAEDIDKIEQHRDILANRGRQRNPDWRG